MKIVDLRPGLQVLHPQYGLGEVKVLTEKLQYYITKSYGSLTTFNLLFKEKEQTF